MTKFCEILEKELKNKRLRRSDLIRATGIPNTTIIRWYSGSMPSVDKAFLVASFLDVSIEYMLTGKDINSKYVLSDLENNFIEIYRKVDAKDKKLISDFVTMIEKNYINLNNTDLKEV